MFGIGRLAELKNITLSIIASIHLVRDALRHRGSECISFYLLHFMGSALPLS